jgi:molybdate transport system substrate-binding protein
MSIQEGVARASAVVCLATLVLAGCSSSSGTSALTVSVASSLQNAMEELQELYTRTHGGAKLTFNFGSSGMLAQQIEHGAPADVFVSAAPKPMDELESQGLLAPGTRRELLRNRIVLITPKASAGLLNFPELTLPAVKLIAIGDPDSVPAGDYGRQVLIAFGIWEQVRPKLVLAKDVRQVLSYVQMGSAEAGIVYATDVRGNDAVQVAATAPENTHLPVIYPVAVLKQSRNVAAARAFETFLAGPQAAAAFARYGFAPPSP